VNDEPPLINLQQTRENEFFVAETTFNVSGVEVTWLQKFRRRRH
jgi:hypothetical protein